MDKLIRSNIADIDLLKPLKRDNVGALLPEGDALANRYGANVYRGREPVDLTGYTAQCWFIRPSKDTLLLDCVIDGNTVYVDLKPECYNAIGLAVMTFKLVKDNVTTTIRIVDGYVRETQTDVAAGNVAVNIIEAVERAEAAADRAESAGGGGGSGGGLPTGGAAHQMLVTDADGNALWEDRKIYSYSDTVEVLPETTVEINPDDVDGYITEPLGGSLVAGNDYTVTYNGTEYVCKAQEVQVDFVLTCVGNVGAMTGEGDTGEPFVFAVFPPEIAQDAGFYAAVYALDGSATVTIKIGGVIENIHRLDHKYLPEYMYGEENEDVTFLNETSFSESAGSVGNVSNFLLSKRFDSPLVMNAVYTVMWNGVPYECTPHMGAGSIMANEQVVHLAVDKVFTITEEVFEGDGVLYYGVISSADGSTSVTLSITGVVNTVYPVPEKYLPKLNIVNGSAEGSLRSVNAEEEKNNYEMGKNSVSLGDRAEAPGEDSFAAGPRTSAAEDNTVAIGYQCWAGSWGQSVFGFNNVVDYDGKYAYIVGNGKKLVSDSQGEYLGRSNGFTLDWDGNAWFAGDVYIGGTSQADAKKLATVEDVEAAAGGSAAVPAYVRTEAETVARLINQHQSNDSIIFPFLADAHCGYYQDTANAATTLAGQLLHLIGQRVPYDFIVNGGDMANGAWDTTRALSFDQIEDYTELTSDAHRGVPAIWVPGNHDDAPYMATADRVTQKEMFALIGRKNRQSGAICPNGCNYGYLDLESQHLRVIYLDTDDKRGWGTVQVGNGETAPAYLNAHNVGGDQLRWLAETALDFSGKDNAADWSVVVVSHVALDVSGTYTDVVSGTSYANSTANAASVLSAYASGGSGSITHNGILVPYDYSALDARATVICCVHGHGHKFVNGTVSGILSIGCPNVMNGRERESSDGNTYTKTAGTAEGTSFCIMTIDRENHKVYADCVGVGPDREFEYTTEVMPYTNLLPISTDADGAVYNGKGYKENTYLSSGADGTKSGIYASGYIQGVANEYGNYFFYCKNVGMQTGQDSHRVALYDETKSYITTVKTTVTGNPFTYGADGNVSQLMFTGASYPDGLYIRICCGYLGDDSVITANEPIE